jgi:hypothetical protein
MAVEIDDGHFSSVGVVELPRCLAVKQKVIVNEGLHGLRPPSFIQLRLS